MKYATMSTIHLFRLCSFAMVFGLLASCYSYTAEDRKADTQRQIDAGIKYSEKMYEENLSRARLNHYKSQSNTDAVMTESKNLESKVFEKEIAKKEYEEINDDCKNSLPGCIIEDAIKPNEDKKQK